MAQEEILLKNSFRTDLACESRDVWTRTRGADLGGNMGTAALGDAVVAALTN